MPTNRYVTALLSIVLALTVVTRLAAQSVAEGSGRVTLALAIVSEPSLGTAFAIRSTPARTLFLTAAHVVGCRMKAPCESGGHVTVFLNGDLRKSRAGRVIKMGSAESANDLALFVIDEGELPTVTFADDLAPGRPAATLGYPEDTLEAARDASVEADASPVLAVGTVQRIGGGVIEGSFATRAGDSGGPVFEPNSGKVFGVVHGRGENNGPYIAVGPGSIRAFVGSFLTGDLPVAGVGAAIAHGESVPSSIEPYPQGGDGTSLYEYAKRVRNEDLGSYARALREAAEAGNGFAADDLSYAYRSGAGVPVDSLLAASWHDRAMNLLSKMAEDGDGQADYVLARYAEDGIGVRLVDDNTKVVLHYLLRGALRHNCSSINELSKLYRLGGLIAHDAQKAAEWSRRSAEEKCEKDP